jgi:hypothetical protein
MVGKSPTLTLQFNIMEKTSKTVWAESSKGHETSIPLPLPSEARESRQIKCGVVTEGM